MKKENIIILLLTIAITLFVILNANKYFFRIDVTKNKVYTISKESRKIVENLDGKVDLTYYISKALLKDKVEAQAIQDLLYEYSNFKNVSLQVIKLDTGDKKTSDLKKAGIDGVQYTVISSGKQSIAMVYSTIQIDYLGKRQYIPFILDDGVLEYRLSSILKKMGSNNKKVVGIMVASRYISYEKDLQYLTKSLQLDFEVRKIEPEEPITKDVNLLYVFGQDLLNERSLYNIDQYVMSARPVFFAQNGVNIDVASNRSTEIKNGILFDYLNKYGIELQKNFLLDESNQVVILGNRILDYPMWSILTPENSNKKNPLTRNFAGLDLFWPSTLKIKDDKKDKISVLLSSSKKSWYTTKTNDLNPMLFATEFDKKDKEGSYPVNVFYKGKAESYFKNRDDLAFAKNRIKSTQKAKIMVLSNQYFLSGQLLRNQYNIDYFLNSVEYLTSSEDLLNIKTKNSSFNNLRGIDKSRKQGIAIRSKVFNLILLPILLFIISLYNYISNKKKEGGR